MIFKVKAGKDIFELNPELLAIEQFERLTPKQMTYVALSTDYKSPFRKLPTSERKLQAALTAGYKMDKDHKRGDTNTRNLCDGKVGSVEAAIEKYKTLQVNDDYEALLSISQLIRDITEANLKPNKNLNDTVQAVALTTKLITLMESKKKLEAILDIEQDHAVETEKGKIVVSDDDYIDEGSLPLLSILNAEE